MRHLTERHEWHAEISVDESLARRLIGQQFPTVPLRTLRLLAEGWDNVVWLVDGEWVFRFPRRAIALPGFEREMTLLPRLAPRLPLPVPAAVFRGRPAAEYPWPFFGAPFLPGAELAESGLADEARRPAARALGAFLRRLHEPVVAAELGHGLPADPMGRADMVMRVSRTKDRLAEVSRLGLWDGNPAVEPLLRDASLLPAPPASAIVHGDLHVRHLLVAEDGTASGVIDWGDVCRGDPSIDLLIAWSAFSGEARAGFLAAYGHVSEEQRIRARVLGLFLSATLAIYARHEGMPALEREAVAGLERVSHDR